MFTILLITLLLVLALGVLYVVVLRPMPHESASWRAVAQTGFVTSILAAVLTALAALASFTSLFEATPINGPFGLAAFLGLPVALVGVGCDAIGLKSEMRNQALIGLVLSIVCIVAWIIMATVAY